MSPETLLYLVPTPIGNLQDITLRALEVLRTVDLILAEDTRNSGKLLKHFEISKPLKSFHAFNEHQKLGSFIDLLKEGKKIALITDAGTPGISDPGFLLVRKAVAEGIPLECLPGATALIPALVKSGFPSDRFVFEGFLPHKKGRQARLKQLQSEERTFILYESPHRLVKTLEQLMEYLGEDREVSVSRELTKIYEETLTGCLRDVHAQFAARASVKGELVIVVNGMA